MTLALPKPISLGGSSASSGHFSERELNEEDIVNKVAEQYGVQGVKIGHDPPSSYMAGSDSINLELSLSKLFNCMSLAYGRDIKIAAPKFRPHKGFKITRREKSRMNNIVWRDWHQQFIKKLKPSVCTFCALDFENQHKRPTHVLMEGQYWKRRVEVVVAEYKKWRVFNKANQISGRKFIGLSEEELLLRVAYHGRMEYLPNYQKVDDSPQSRESADADFFNMDLSSDIFSAIQTLGFPHHTPGNHIEINSLDHLDILQPSLISLEEDLLFGDLDTAKPLEDLLVEAVNYHMGNLNNAMPGQKRPRSHVGEGRLPPMLPDFHQHPAQPPPYSVVRKRPRSVIPDSNPNDLDLSNLTPLTASSNANPDFLSLSGFIKQEITSPVSNLGSHNTQYSPTYSNMLTDTPAHSNMLTDTPTHSNMLTDTPAHSNMLTDTPAHSNMLTDTPAFTNNQTLGSSNPILNNPQTQLRAGTHVQEFSYQNSMTKSNSGYNQASISDEYTPNGTLFDFGEPLTSRYSLPNTSLPLDAHRRYALPNNQSSDDSFRIPEQRKILRRHQSEPTASNFLSQPSNPSRTNFLTQLDVSPHHVNRMQPTSDDTLSVAMDTYTPPLPAFPTVTYQPNPGLLSPAELSPRSMGTFPPSHHSPSSLSSSTSLTSPSTDFVTHSVAGVTSEQKRRQSIKQSFDTLSQILPTVGSTGSNKASNAQILMNTTEYITQCHAEQKERQAEMEVLEREVNALTSAISISQGQLPATGLPGPSDHNDTMRHRYKSHVRDETAKNWKYYLFGKLMNPLFDTYCDSVCLSNMDGLYRSAQGWLDQHCNLPVLRANALQSMREVSCETSILSQPTLLPDQARKCVQEP